MIDCATGEEYINAGCSGGLPNFAFDYLIDLGGLALRSEYPYEAHEGTCNKRNFERYASIKSYAFLDSEEGLKNLVGALQDGPVSVAVGANDAFLLYSSGVFDAQCDIPTNHAVNIVGYA